MGETISIENHKAFLDSLDGEKGLPEEMHGWRFDEPMDGSITIGLIGLETKDHLIKLVGYLEERCIRAESRQITDLKERVKELVRDAMEAENRLHTDKWTDHTEWKQYFDMCSPEVKP